MISSSTFYFKQLKDFRFPKDTIEHGKIRTIIDFNKEERVDIRAIFGYDQLGVQLEAGSIKVHIKEIQDALSRIIRAYTSFRKRFLKEICPSTMNDEKLNNTSLEDETLLLDLSEYLEGLDEQNKHNTMIMVDKYIHSIGLSTYVELVPFNSKLEAINKQMKTGIEFGESFIDATVLKDLTPLQKQEFKNFYNTYIIGEKIFFIIYHHIVTPAMSDRQGAGIIDMCRIGFWVNMTLYDLHYDMLDLDSLLEQEQEALSESIKSRLSSGIADYEERLIRLETRARRIDKDSEAFVDLSLKFFDSMKKPFEYSSGKTLVDYSTEMKRLLSKMESRPDSKLESAIHIEYRHLGVRVRYRDRLEQLGSDLRLLKIKSVQTENKLYFTFSILLIVVFFVIAQIYDLSLIANILQVITFVLALLLLLMNIGAVRKIFEYISRRRKE